MRSTGRANAADRGRRPSLLVLLVCGLGTFSWSPAAAAAEAAAAAQTSPIEGPVALVCLVSAGDRDLDVLSWRAAAVQKQLGAFGRVKIVSSDRVTRLLRGARAIEPRDEELEFLKGMFHKGYLSFYTFQNVRTVEIMQQLTEKLKRLPPSPERWELWVKAQIFEAISKIEMGNKSAAMRAFARVLRTRSDMELSAIDYSPKYHEVWKQTRRRMMGKLKRGKLAVKSDIVGAAVLLDGHRVGTTPFEGSFPRGRYHLQVFHEETGGTERWVRITAKPVRVRLELAFEGPLVLDFFQPCVRLPAEQDRLPDRWWPWLGRRLGVRQLVTVRRFYVRGRAHLAAALVDLKSGRQLREGWVELRRKGGDALRQYASDLAAFIITGKASELVQVGSATRRKKRVGPEPTAIVPRVSIRATEAAVEPAGRRWYRSWWPYVAAGGAALAFGLGAQLAAAHFNDQAESMTGIDRRRAIEEKASAWQAAAIGGYALAGAAAVTGLVLNLTYEPEPSAPEPAVQLAVGPGQFGIVWTGRF